MVTWNHIPPSSKMLQAAPTTSTTWHVRYLRTLAELKADCVTCANIYNPSTTNIVVISLNNLCRTHYICFFVNHRHLKTRSTSPSLWLSQLCDVPFMWGTWRSTTAQRWRSTFCRMSWRPSNRGWGCWWTTTGWGGCGIIHCSCTILAWEIQHHPVLSATLSCLHLKKRKSVYFLSDSLFLFGHFLHTSRS